MPALISRPLRSLLLLLFLLTAAFRSQATHIFGIDLFYTWVTGNTYKVNLVVYGDCSGSAFPTFPTSAPIINVYNGNTLFTSITLAVQAPATGIEVTPVCPAQIDSTTCTNLTNPIPGIKKFVYSGNVTLSGPSAVWRFLFQGALSPTTAGRSNSITNVISGTTIQLVDTLNNTTAPNSSAIYTTIPTPFYCLLLPATFNPGAVDPNTDSLAFSLVPGIDASSGTSVTYISPYTATAPLGTTPGTYTFNSVTGQLSFTPNVLQKALVVYNVEEWRGGVLRGTSQREMTVVVITPCSNVPPNGLITSPSAGTIGGGGTTLSVCQAVGPFNFHINPTDPAGANITMTVSGLPPGAAVAITGNGTHAPLATFSWSTTGVTPGSYIFYVNYKNDGCPLTGEQTIAYTINVLPSPTEVYALVSPATCLAKAVFHVTPGGGLSPWVFSVIQGGITIATLPGITGMVTDSLVAGTYTLRTTGTNGCTADTTITIASPPLPSGTVTVSPPLCPGGSTAGATVVGSAGLAPYTYAIGSGTYSSSGVFTGLTPGSYVLHVKDANGCIKDTTVTVPDAPPTLLSLNVHKPLCDTFSNGWLVINASNSIAPYTFSRGSGAYTTNDTFGMLAAGTYTFHIKNGNGCIKDTTVTLADSSIIHAAIGIAPVLCHGGTGTITLTGTGGYPAYSYAFGSNPFGSSGSFTLAAGTYVLHTRDIYACHFDTSITLTQPTALSIAVTDTNVHCYGASTGIIAVTASGGTPAYLYAIGSSTYGIAAVFSGLAAGTQVISVKDANGCIKTDTVTLTQPSPIHIDSVIARMPRCNTGADGTFSIYASGGTAPYTYASGSGAYSTASLIAGIAAGSYTLHVKDANGCIKDTTLTMSEPGAIIPSAAVTKSVCATLGNGKVTLTAAGGIPGYTYALGTGVYGATGIFTPLVAGTYTFHVKDANGCIKDTAILVSDSLVVSATLVITPPLCYNTAAGSINVTGTGGTSPYTYANGAAPFGAVHLFSALPAAAYTIHVKDNNGCLFDTTVTITQPAALLPGLTITMPSCNGYADGVITASATGGTPAYSFSYNGSAYAAAAIFSGLAAGTGILSVRDSHGCTHDTAITIAQPDRIVFADLAITGISCYQGADGTVTITGGGATPPYTYALNADPWQTANIFTALAAGTEEVRIKDSRGCEVDTLITLSQPAKLLFTLVDTTNPTCPGYADGSVSLAATGGTIPYTWADDSVTFGAAPTFAALPAGTYPFAVKDAKGCIADSILTLKGLPAIIVDSAAITPALCYGAANGTISVYASGGAPPLAYQLDTARVATATAAYSGMMAGTYQVKITDSRNCYTDTTVHVSQPDPLALADSVTPNECNGTELTGRVALAPSGGTAPYTYVWNNNPAMTTGTITGMPNGRYIARVKDANNCTDTIAADIIYNDCCTPYLPNAFTPNGDGKNEIYRFRFSGDMFIVRFSIYNRFGEEVYNLANTANIDQGWDGMYKGIRAELGVYYYYARIICGNKGDHVKEMKGDVTLLR